MSSTSPCLEQSPTRWLSQPPKAPPRTDTRAPPDPHRAESPTHSPTPPARTSRQPTPRPSVVLGRCTVWRWSSRQPPHPATHLVLRFIGHDPQQPRPHRTRAPIARSALVRLHETLLRNIERFSGRPANNRSHPQRRTLMPTHQLPERNCLPGAGGAIHQVVVGTRLQVSRFDQGWQPVRSLRHRHTLFGSHLDEPIVLADRRPHRRTI